MFKFCRFVYNSALEERISFYKKYGKSLSYYQQAGELIEVKSSFSESESLHSQTLQQVLKQLDSAYVNFFRNTKTKSGKAGFPRFKNEDRFRSILFPQCNLKTGGVKRLPEGKLEIKGVPGEVKAIWHRPFQGRCKQVRIVKSSGNFYIILMCTEVPQEPRPKTGKEIGIDLGIETFIYGDDGTTFHHPKPYKTAKEKLAYKQRKLQTKQRGSNNRKKLKHRIAKQYEKITNIRKDFQHKVAKQLVDKYDKIYIENLNIKKMLESKGFAVSKSNISEASWGNFVNILEYKAERAGILVIKVDAARTSQTCSQCGNIRKILLKEREYKCEVCELRISRDLNAAINIHGRGTRPDKKSFSFSEAPPFREG